MSYSEKSPDLIDLELARSVSLHSVSSSSSLSTLASSESLSSLSPFTSKRKSIQRRKKTRANLKKVARHLFAIFWIGFGLFCYFRPGADAKYHQDEQQALLSHHDDFDDFDITPHLSSHKKKKNIIFMVSDGMGPASLSLTRSFRQFRDNLPIDDILTLDKFLIGSSRTRSFDSLVTDSAAGATAFSCAMKSYNGAIAVDPLQNPCGTILEALKLKGYMTGLVVTTSLTDATPASFAAHADYRSQQSLIAQQLLGYNTTLGRSVDLLIGGGKCFFDPMFEQGSCRKDQLDLIEIAARDGWTIANNKKEFDALNRGENVTLPLLSLLAGYNIPYDLDRDENVYPSLEEEAITALTALSKATEDSDQGFFLLIEGSRIDHAGHDNDPAAQVREVLAYDRTFKAVVDFADNSDVETFIISTSDHETGGLVTARQVTDTYPDYLWYPEVLLNSSASGEKVSKELNTYLSSALIQENNISQDDIKIFIKKNILEKQLGIYDYTEEDIKNLISPNVNKQYYMNNMISFRSQTGWSTHGHSAVDVNIYAHSNTKHGKYLLFDKLAGNHENIEIGKFMEMITGSDLHKVTKLLKGTDHHNTPTVADLNSVDEPATPAKLGYYHESMIHHIDHPVDENVEVEGKLDFEDENKLNQ